MCQRIGAKARVGTAYGLHAEDFQADGGALRGDLVERALATDKIEEAGWVDGNLHRLEEDWAGGMKVKVHRGADSSV